MEGNYPGTAGVKACRERGAGAPCLFWQVTSPSSPVFGGLEDFCPLGFLGEEGGRWEALCHINLAIVNYFNFQPHIPPRGQ